MKFSIFPKDNILDFLTSIFKRIGIDKSIAYSSGSRVVTALFGVFTIFIVAFCLSGDEQGFYFTFGSLLALQVFFELGFTSILTQYVAHEASHLTLGVHGRYTGDSYYLSRLSSLIHFCINWYSLIGIGVFFFLTATGFLFFGYFSEGTSATVVDWKWPWVIICFATTIKFFQSPLTSIFMGLDYMEDMTKVMFLQNIIQPLTIWLLFLCGIKLYAVGIGYFSSCMVWFFYVYGHKLSYVLINLWRVKITDRIDYFKEILPFQWRIALSWISGYFIYNLFNPVLFAAEGAIVAGQMGMTISVLSAIQNFSNSWVSTKVPIFSKQIALKKYVELDVLFNKTNRQMSCVSAVLLLLFNFLVMLFRFFNIKFYGIVLADRFITAIPLLLMSIAIFCNIWLTTWGIYLRCHKKEPLLTFSITSGICCCLSILCLGYYYGLYGITIGYSLIMVASMPWVYMIFKSKKNKWHER